jgi:probable rRNA maturation factor
VVVTDHCELVDLPVARLRDVLERILADHDRDGELSVAFIDDAGISELHGRFLGDPSATDVLSFLLDDESDGPPADQVGEDSAGPFGEVVVSCETALREAEKRDLPVATEAALYAIHGTLHLVGYDDRDEEDSREMRRQEAYYLEIFTSTHLDGSDDHRAGDEGASQESPGLTN